MTINLYCYCKPNAKETKVETVEVDDEKIMINVYLSTPARENRANDELLLLCREIFHLHKNEVRIISGKKSKNKIVQLDYNGTHSDLLNQLTEFLN